MGKFLLTIAVILGAIATIKWADGTLFWIGVGVLSFAGLITFTVITYFLAKHIKWSLTLAVYDILTIATITTLMFKGIAGVNVGLCTLMPLTALFSLVVVRVIGCHAQTSVIWSEIFSWLTGYKIKNIIKVDSKGKASKLVKVDEVIGENEERDNIVAFLTSKTLNFKMKEAREAADYAMSENPNADTEDKVKCAMNYIESNKVLKGI